MLELVLIGESTLNAEQVAKRPHATRTLVRTVGIALAATLLTAGCAAGQLAGTSTQRSSIDATNQTFGPIDLRGLSISAPPTGNKSYPQGTDAQLNLVLINTATSDDRLIAVRTSAATSWAYYNSYAEAYRVRQASFASASPSAGATGSEPSSSAASSSTPASPAISTPVSTSPGASSASSAAPTSGAATSSAPAASGVESVTLQPNIRLSSGTPDAVGEIVLRGITKALFPGDSVSITFTFAKAGSVTIAVPVQLADLPRTAEVPGGSGEGEH